MTLMSIVMSIFTTGIIQIYRSVVRTEAVSGAQSQLNTAFLRLDREVRYAAEISEPGPGPGREPRVEFRTSHTGDAVTCTQLRLVVDSAGGRLQRRTWEYVPDRLTGSPLKNLTPFTTLASAVAAGTAAGLPAGQPFQRTLAPVSAATGTADQRLRVVLTVRSAPGGSLRRTDVTFTTLNSSIPVPTPEVCDEGRTLP
jgi:hypothetical protein